MLAILFAMSEPTIPPSRTVYCDEVRVELNKAVFLETITAVDADAIYRRCIKGNH